MTTLRTAKAQFKSRYQMLVDIAGSLDTTAGVVAATVARRQFHAFYPQIISAYEVIISSSDEDITREEKEQFEQQFSIVNRLLVRLEQAIEPTTGSRESDVKPQGQVISAKLPAIELPRFTGKVHEWLSFHDLFQSLVHCRNITDAEKHYYLRASLEGEPLSLIRQLPMDENNYPVALKLLQDRYQNKRLLVDTYLARIANLPVITEGNMLLQQQFYDTLRESLQALEKLEMPVTEWSYIIVFLTLQKLPVRIRTAYEERYGKDAQVLPTIAQLLELLDEQCRVHRTVVPEAAGTSAARGRKPPPSQRVRRVEDAPRPAAPGRLLHAQPSSSSQVTSIQCSFCSGQGHTLYRCEDLRLMVPAERKAWAKRTGLCFKCLRSHYARDCTQKNWCAHCGSVEHNSLVCTGDVVASTSRGQGRVAINVASRSRRGSRPTPSPPRSPQSSRQESPVVDEAQHTWHATPETASRVPAPTHQQLGGYVPRPRQGARARQAQVTFEDLRFGSRNQDETR